MAKFNIAVPLPGSQLFEEFVRGKDVKVDPYFFNSWTDWSKSDTLPLSLTDKMTSREIIQMQRKGMIKFYLRPGKILKHIFSGTLGLKDLLTGAFILFKLILKK